MKALCVRKMKVLYVKKWEALWPICTLKMRAPYIKNDRPYVKKWWAGFFYIFVETATPNEKQKSIFKTTTDFFLFVVVPKNNLGWLILKKNFVLIQFWCHNKNRYICVNNNNNKGGGSPDEKVQNIGEWAEPRQLLPPGRRPRWVGYSRLKRTIAG